MGEFNIHEIEKAPINASTKQFLKGGFPNSAAPFVGFGWRIYNDKFLNIADAYPKYKLGNSAKNYWIFGSDGSGNPICFDITNNDKVVLLDHEQRFALLDIMNSDIAELAACLLAYKNFGSRVQQENGKGAFLDSNISPNQLADLKDEFKQINNDIFKISDFWRNEINSLAD